MALAHVAGQLVQFAHVPRSGGSAIENYLMARFGPVGFLDRRYLKLPMAERWSNSSPQHLPAEAFDRLIPRSWIAHRFALVRHPEDRLVSVFRYQRDVEQMLPHETEFEAWVEGLPTRLRDTPNDLDNHPRPATGLVPEDATVFRLEDGMEPVVAWLDGIEGVKRGPRAIQSFNSYAARMEGAKRAPGLAPTVTADVRRVIAEVYAADFARFGYVPRDSDPDNAATASEGPEGPDQTEAQP